MGMDLTLCPHGFWYPGQPLDENRMFLTTFRAPFDRDYDIFAQVADIFDQGSEIVVCEPKPLPSGWKFEWYGDEGIEERTTTPYGDDLTFVFAKELAPIKEPQATSAQNKAIIAMVRTLHPDHPIVLWWH